MNAELIVSIIVLVVVGLILLAIIEKFSPDATITYVSKLVIGAAVVILVVQKMMPLFHL